jgi:hypothetical protein
MLADPHPSGLCSSSAYITDLTFTGQLAFDGCQRFRKIVAEQSR